MLNMMKKEGGFTLVELMVVILIIAILLAIAIPVFLSARDRAVVRSAQSRLKQVVNAAKELHGGGNKTTVTGTEKGIPYEDMTIAELNGELDTISVISGTGALNYTNVAKTAQGTDTITFKVLDTNDNKHTAVIDTSGTVTIN